MDQGDITMIYLHVCHHQRASRDGSVARPQLDASGPKSLAGQRAEFEAQGVDLTVFYKTSLSTLDDIEFLLETTADVKRCAGSQQRKLAAAVRCFHKLPQKSASMSEIDQRPSTPPGKLAPLKTAPSTSKVDAHVQSFVKKVRCSSRAKMRGRDRQSSIDCPSDASTCAGSGRAESPEPFSRKSSTEVPEPFSRKSSTESPEPF